MELIEALKKEMRRRKSLHCIYGVMDVNGGLYEIEDARDAKKAIYFSSENSFRRVANSLDALGFVVRALHPHNIGK